MRAVVLGLALVPPTILWLHQLEIVWYSSQPTTISLYYHVIFTLLVLICGFRAKVTTDSDSKCAVIPGESDHGVG